MMSDPVATGPTLGRRDMTRLMVVLCAGAVCAPFTGARAAGGDPPFTDPGEDLLAFMKLQCRSDDGYTNYVNTGTVYAAVPGHPSLPMYGYEGLLRFHTRVVAPNVYDMTFIEAGCYLDLKTGQRMDRFDNPVSGATNTVKHIVEGPGLWRWTTENLNVSDPAPAVHRRVAWQEFGDQSWLHFDNIMSMGAPGGPLRHPAALVTYVGQTSQIKDKACASVSDTMLIDSSINPWADWLAMGDAPGRLVNNIIGRKLGAISETPDGLMTYIAAAHPAVPGHVEAWKSARG